MHRFLLLCTLMLLGGVLRAEDDPWKSQYDRTKAAIEAAEKSGDAGYSDDSYGGSSTPSDPLGKEHAEAVVKKQKQRLAAIEAGRSLAIPASRADRTRYATYVRGKAELLQDRAWVPLKLGYPLAPGDRLRVAAGGLVSLWIRSGFLTLDGKTQASLLEDNAVMLTGGRMHWENLVKGDAELQCRTPTVLATTKGTEFDMLLRGAESVFVPVTGIVELRSLADAVAMARDHAKAAQLKYEEERRNARAAEGAAAAKHAAAAGSAATAVAVPASEPPPAAAGSRIVSIGGSVTIQRGRRSDPAHAGDALGIGDVVSTGHGARARLELAGGFRVELAGDSRFEVQKRSYSLLEGLAHVRTFLASLAGEEEWSFQTPNAVAAVRGTEFKLRYVKPEDRDEFVPQSGVIEVTARRRAKFKDAEQWWNQE